MKNLIIAALVTYVFYTDFCVIRLWYVIPFIFLTAWFLLAETDELIRDYQNSVRRGRKLQLDLKRAERGW